MSTVSISLRSSVTLENHGEWPGPWKSEALLYVSGHEPKLGINRQKWIKIMLTPLLRCSKFRSTDRETGFGKSSLTRTCWNKLAQTANWPESYFPVICWRKTTKSLCCTFCLEVLDIGRNSRLEIGHDYSLVQSPSLVNFWTALYMISSKII